MNPPIQRNGSDTEDEDKNKKPRRLSIKARPARKVGGRRIKEIRASTKMKRDAKLAEKRGWFPKKRERTSFSLTSATPRQGPHLFPHVGKVLMGIRSLENNSSFDPTKIKARTGVLPSAGQARKLMRYYQQDTGLKVPKKNLKKLDKLYKQRLEERKTRKTKAERIRATARAMELNPMATYGHGRKPTHDEMKGKGERMTTVAPDLDKLEKMGKDEKTPKLERVDFGDGFREKHVKKLLRDTGTISRGEDNLSDLDTSSDEEYSDGD